QTEIGLDFGNSGLKADGLSIELGGGFEIPLGLGLLRRGQEGFKLRSLLRKYRPVENEEDRTTGYSGPNSAQSSPVKFKRCLHLSRSPCLVDRPEPCAHIGVRAVVVGVVEGVEHIETELEPESLFKWEVLLNTNVPIPVPRGA